MNKGVKRKDQQLFIPPQGVAFKNGNKNALNRKMQHGMVFKNAKQLQTQFENLVLAETFV